MNELDTWRNRVALVTGASSGIGWAVARELAAIGMRVVLCARRSERLQALQHELEETGAQAMSVPTDLRSETQILDLFTAIRREWGGVDVLVNNAGLGHKTSLLEGKSEHWREMFDVNVLALSICTREAVKDMRREDNGYVIHVSSMSGHRVPTGAGSGMYAATKHAVTALTEALRIELRRLGSQIRVTAISPGFVETEFAARYHKNHAAAQETYSQYPVLQPRDIAALVRSILATPPHVQIHDVLVRPTEQKS